MNSEAIKTLVKNAMEESGVESHTQTLINRLRLINSPGFLAKANDPQRLAELVSDFYDSLFFHSSSLSRASPALFAAAFDFNWQFLADCGPATASFARLVLQALSFDSKLLPSIFARLVDVLNCRALRLSPVQEKTREQNNENTQNEENEEKKLSAKAEKVAAVHSAVHQLIAQICDLFPFSAQELILALVKGFPYKTKDCFTSICYVRSLLRVTEYSPVLGERIVSLLFRKMNELDLEISSNSDSAPCTRIFTKFIAQHLVAFSSEVSEFLQDHLIRSFSTPQKFMNEDEIFGAKKESEIFGMESEAGAKKQPNKNLQNEQMAEKLQAMMKLLFDYFAAAKKNRRFMDKLFNTILTAFESEILNNKTIKNTPFIVFYLASLSSSYTDKLIRFLLNKLSDESKPFEVRRNSVLFLAGFLVHSKFTRKILVLKAFDFLLELAANFLDEYEPEKMVKSCDAQNDTYAFFYSVCESAFYLFIHRHEQLQSSPEYEDQISALSRLTGSKLVPLQFCAQEVVVAFAAFSFAVGAVDCFPVLLCNYRFFRRDKSNVLVARRGFLGASEKRFFDREHAAIPFVRCNLSGVAGYFGDIWVSEEELHQKVSRKLEREMENAESESENSESESERGESESEKSELPDNEFDEGRRKFGGEFERDDFLKKPAGGAFRRGLVERSF